MINIGENNISVYAGDSEVSVYMGSELIYPLNLGELTAITIDNLTWVTDISWEGGTGTSANCSYVITGYYDSGKTKKITDMATVEGSITADSTTSETRDLVGTLVLTATCSGLSATGSVDAYQEAAVHDYSKDYLTMNVISGGTISWLKGGSSATAGTNIQYSKDNGATWTTISSITTLGYQIPVETGDKVLFKGDNDRYMVSGQTSVSYANRFLLTGCTVDIEGNIMSMTAGDNFTAATSVASYAFTCLFASNSSGIRYSSNLVLPATTLGEACYRSLFDSSRSLETTPKVLPATTAVAHCYRAMFYGCTSLTSVSITISAATWGDSSCKGMFRGCTSLTTAPSLPATTLYQSCYAEMFQGCTSLTTAPELPASTLTQQCYQAMFYGCTSLNYIKCLAMSWVSDSLRNWAAGVAATGTFVKASGVTWTTGNNGIPSGWAVQESIN